MMWIFPSNNKIYNTNLAFEENTYIDWHYTNENFNIGDIVFIYISTPIKKITHMTKVVFVDVPEENLIDDRRYWVKNDNFKEQKYVRLKLIKILNDDRFTYGNLKENGLNFNVRCKMKVNDELEKYINKCLDNPIHIKTRKMIFPRLIVCNLGWSEKYDGTGKVTGGGEWVDRHGFGHEIKNFYNDNGYYEGFVQSINEKINLERISSSVNGDTLEDVLVVFTAKNPHGNRTIVGFYNHAVVTRELVKRDNDNYLGYYFRAKVEDSILLEPNEREYEFGKTRKGNMGQSNIWYADTEEAIDEINRIQEYILDIIQNGSKASKNSSIIQNENDSYSEGAISKELVTYRKRNASARQKCLDKYGYKCSVCGFDFEKVYGEVGKEFIHVHHINFISNTDEEHEIDPEVDLIPVCPNCHYMLHRKNNGRYLTIEELQQSIEDSKSIRIGSIIDHPVFGKR